MSVAIFGLAWVLQIYGHRLEKKHPAFLKDLQFLLIGPAWLMHFLYERLGIRYLNATDEADELFSSTVCQPAGPVYPEHAEGSEIEEAPAP